MEEMKDTLILDGGGNGSQGQQDAPGINPKPKPHWLATLSAWCFFGAVVGGFAAAILFSTTDMERHETLSAAVAIVLISMLVATPLLGILSLMRICAAPVLYSGKGLAWVSIGISSFFLFMTAPVTGARDVGNEMTCRIDLNGLGKSFWVYAQDHNGNLPDSQAWCDQLITEADMVPDMFVCPSTDAEYGESSYALNKYVVGRKLAELPPEMVLLFEAAFNSDTATREYPLSSRGSGTQWNGEKYRDYRPDRVFRDRWNQVGGPERLAVNNHTRPGCNVLFADSSVRFIEFEELSHLRWTIEGEADFPVDMLAVDESREIFKKYALIVLGAVVLVATLLVLRRSSIGKHIGLALFLMVLAAGAGGLFGSMAEILYRNPTNYITGGPAGAIFGALAAIWFVAWLVRRAAMLPSGRQAGYAAALGMATGVVCSTLVHLVMMITYEQPQINGMLAGIPFGVLAGLILGAIGGGLFKSKHSLTSMVKSEANENQEHLQGN